MPRLLHRLFRALAAFAFVGAVSWSHTPVVSAASSAGPGHAGAGSGSGAGSGGWRSPVPGAVVRPFAYARAAAFRRGAHRGVDLAARPGSAVRAACAGRVVTAGASPGGRVLTLRCGRWRVAVLPLSTIGVRPGARVRAGARIGSAARSRAHAGLHVSVRADGDPFGYVDPAPFFASPAPSPAVPVVTGARPGDLGPAPRAHAPPVEVAAPAAARPAPAASPAPAVRPGGARRPSLVAEPPPAAWLGLALLAAGAAGGGGLALRSRVRRHGAAAARAERAHPAGVR